MTEVSTPTLHERLATLRAAAELGRHRSPAETQRVLETRARQLARPAAVDAEAGEFLDLLVFRVGEEVLALPIDSIVAVARPTGIAVLPRAARPVYGVTAWRGRTLTVLSLASSQSPVTADTRLVVLGSGARAALAVVADLVDDIQRLARHDLTAAPPGPRSPYALGITPDGLFVADGDALLHPESITT